MGTHDRRPTFTGRRPSGQIRKDLMVLGVSGTLPNLLSLSSLCAPVVDEEVRRRASFSVSRQPQDDDSANEDEDHVDAHQATLVNKNYVEKSEEIPTNNNTDESTLKAKTDSVLDIISDTLDNSFIVLNMGPDSNKDKTEVIQGKGGVERGFSKKTKKN